MTSGFLFFHIDDRLLAHPLQERAQFGASRSEERGRTKKPAIVTSNALPAAELDALHDAGGYLTRYVDESTQRLLTKRRGLMKKLAQR